MDWDQSCGGLRIPNNDYRVSWFRSAIGKDHHPTNSSPLVPHSFCEKTSQMTKESHSKSDTKTVVNPVASTAPAAEPAQRVLTVGLPDLNYCDNVVTTSKYTWWSFLPVVSNCFYFDPKGKNRIVMIRGFASMCGTAMIIEIQTLLY